MLKHDQLYIVIDAESSGLNLYYSRPWQISWVEHRGTKFIEEHDLYIDLPNLHLSPFIKKLTGFDQRKYDREKIPPIEAYNLLMPKLLNPEYRIIGQNFLRFDIYMVAVLQRLAGKPVDYSYLNRIIDTLALAKAWKHEIAKPNNGSGFLYWQLKILNDSLLKKRASQLQLLKDLDIEFDKELLHNSLYDVQKCKQIFDALKKRLSL